MTMQTMNHNWRKVRQSSINAVTSPGAYVEFSDLREGLSIAETDCADLIYILSATFKKSVGRKVSHVYNELNTL